MKLHYPIITSLFSFLCQLTSHCSHLLSAGHAAIDQYLLAAQQEMMGQTDMMLNSFIVDIPHTMQAVSITTLKYKVRGMTQLRE